MRIGLIGYGRMGKTVETFAKNRKHEICSIIDLNYNGEFNSNVDCYIDFSNPNALDKYLQVICEKKIPIVIGTTGWQSKLPEFSALFEKNGDVGIWSGNFSLGVNLYWSIIRQSSKLIDKFSTDYDVLLHEFHHKNKIDSPSGTALHTANLILENFSLKKSIVTESLQRKLNDSELHVTSTRCGTIPGTHTVIFDSNFDTIEITHTARSRDGFALGAIVAAEKITKLNAGLHLFSDVFEQFFL